MIENGFFDEFKLAMANLQANNTAGGSRAGSFAYFGPGSGTAPLPIYLAYIAGRTDASNAAAYSGTTWTNTALTQDMVRTNPQPFNSAGDLDGDNDPPQQRDRRRPAGRTSSSSIRTWTASTSPTAARSATTTRCRSRCAGACRADSW